MSRVLFVSCVITVLLLVEGLPYAEKPISPPGLSSASSVPKITYSKETVTKPGEQIQLDCAVEGVDLSGLPKFQVKWSKVKKDEAIVPLSANERILLLSDNLEVFHPKDTYQYSLRLKKVDEEDTGVYRCTVDFGENQRIDADVDVLVEKAAYFVDSDPKTIKVTEGDAISIDCQPGGSPTPKVYWERVSDEIPYYGGNLVQTNQLDLPLIHRTHRGAYRCYADNGLAEPVASEIFVEVDYKPAVAAGEQEIEATFFDEIRLTCSAEAHPRAEIIWLKDGTPIQPSQNAQIATKRSEDESSVTSTFVIPEAQAEDFAKYTCAAANNLGTAVSEIQVKLKSPPMIVKQSKGEKIFEIEPVYDKARNDLPLALECEATGTPAPTYRWAKNGETLNWETDPRMSLEYGTGTLLIRNPKQTDNGKYQCFAYNDFGIAASEEIKVENSTALEFVRKEPGYVDYEAELGRPYRIACPKALGYPKPELTWMKSREVEAGIEMEYITSDRMVQDEEGTLWFTHITEEDDSILHKFKYVCLASSELYPQDISLAKTVSIKTVHPNDGEHNAYSELVNIESFEMHTSANEQTFVSGRENSLWCIFGGEPAPTVSWSRIDGKDMDVTRIFIKNHGQTLVFKETLSEDAGQYQCMADNRVGTPKLHNFNVNVDVIPEFASDFSEQAKIVPEGTSVTFACSILVDELVNPKYEWFFNSRPIGFVDGSKRKVEGNQLSIRSVSKADIGNYACKASNNAGSAYGQTTLNVIPKGHSLKKDLPSANVHELRQEIDGLKTEVQRLSQLIENKLNTPSKFPELEQLVRQMSTFLLRSSAGDSPQSVMPVPKPVIRTAV